MDDISRAGLVGGGLSLGAGLGSLFGGGGSDPYKAAAPFLNKIPGATHPYYDQYIRAGNQALWQQYGNYNNLLNNPGQMLSQWGQGYQQSPGYQWQLNQGEQAINNAAAAGGMAGTPQHQQYAGQLASNLANQDYYNYLGHVQGLYGAGLQGLSGINQMGFNANDQVARIMADLLSQQGQLQFAGQAAKNQSEGQGAGDILGGIGAIAGSVLGGPLGSAGGGIAGSAVGNAVSHMFGG